MIQMFVGFLVSWNMYVNSTRYSIPGRLATKQDLVANGIL